MSHIELDGREVRLMSICLMFEAMMPARLAGSRISGFSGAGQYCLCLLTQLGCKSCACSWFSYIALVSSLLVA